MNCLHFAVRSMVHVSTGTLQFLIGNGADATATGSSGMTVLHHASSTGFINEETLSFIVIRGVGLNAVNNSGQTTLHHTRIKRMSIEESDYSDIFRHTVGRKVGIFWSNMVPLTTIINHISIAYPSISINVLVVIARTDRTNCLIFFRPLSLG